MTEPPKGLRVGVDDRLAASGLLSLSEASSFEAVELALRRLGTEAADADVLTREAIRAGAVPVLRSLGWRAATVDAVLRPEPEDLTANGSGSRISLDDPEPWPHSVDGPELLGDLVTTFLRYLGLPEWAPVALALWVLHSHAHDAADISPLLALTSPEKRCGKTTTLHVLGALVPRPLPASNVTAAALFRAVERFQPTLLVDEADTFLRNREELLGVLNSGHSRASAYVVRTVGDDHEARIFSTWAPKAVAMIGKLPDTLQDRSIVVPMRRRHPDEKVERLRQDRLSQLEPLQRKAWRWAFDHMDALRHADPEVPASLNDRAADNWRPLLAIADLVSGQMAEQARQAARGLSGVDDGDDGSVRTLLLSDLRELFQQGGVDRLTSAEVVEALGAMEDRPWPEFGRSGKQMTPNALAKLLRGFKVRPKTIKLPDHRTAKGYLRDELTDVWNRYLPRVGGSEASPPEPPSNYAGKPYVGGRHPGDEAPASGTAESPQQGFEVTAVTDVGRGSPETNSSSDLLHDQYERIERESLRAPYRDPGDQ